MSVCTALHGAEDPLPSWSNGVAKRNLLTFVAETTRQGGTNFVPAAERIAVFDNDGTLWVEQPAYPQFYFSLSRVKAAAGRHVEWNQIEPFRSALLGDLKGVLASGVKGLNELPGGACAGLTPDEYAQLVTNWLANARHPRFQRPYTECVYQPMLEVLAFLRSNGFKPYVVSGGAVEFLRPWTERVYGVPPEQVIGTSVTMKFELRDGRPIMVRQAALEHLNNNTEKALAIQRVIGRRPVMAFGNSDGDLPMMQWIAAGAGPRFCAFVHHTDGQREYAYDRDSAVGRLDKGLDEARSRGWTVIDMRQDWKQVFPFDKQ